MIFRVASFLTVVVFFELVSFSVKVSYVGKYYQHFVSTKLWDAVHGNDDLEFDFIVVGAGSAGCVVANRLSKFNKVLLLETGGTPYYGNSIPAMAGMMLHRPETDHMYRTVEQKHSLLGSNGKVSRWPRGKMLGGSSNLNYMAYVRGHPFDYDNWANITKDEEWSWKNLVKIFKRSIDYNGKYVKDDLHYGESYGTQSVEFQENSPLYNTLMEAGKEFGGLQVDIDTNGPQRAGLGPLELNQRKGKRESSFTAFIEPILDRENLVVSTYSQAIKLKLDKSNRITGVWYVQHGKVKFAKARKEVVVSSGSIDSAKLLMLSGIGPKKDLKSVGIESKIDLPVGQNLKDHMLVMLPITTNSSSHSYRIDRDLGVSDLINYYLFGTGLLSKPFGHNTQLFFTSSHEKKATGLDWTDFQVIVSSTGAFEGIPEAFSATFNLRPDIVEELYGDAVRQGTDTFMPSVIIGRPKSTGTIKLQSKNPFQKPIIDPKYLTHPDDIPRYVEAVKFMLKLFEETEAFKKIESKFVKAPLKDCKQHKFRSDKYFECYIRHMALTVYHPVSTCRMGRPGDGNSVVDSKLRVLNTKGLRVADCSIMPDLVNGNTNAAAVMIGEKGADIIREYWSQQYSVCIKLELFSKEWSHKFKCFYSRFA